MRREYPRIPIPGVAAIVFNNNNILLTQRGNEPSQGLWGLPGGVIEVGERVEEAVMREVLEETSIKVKPIKFLQVFESISPDKSGKYRFHYILLEYLCKYVEGAPIPADDALDARWIPLDNLDNIDIMPGTRKFIEKVAKRELVIDS